LPKPAHKVRQLGEYDEPLPAGPPLSYLKGTADTVFGSGALAANPVDPIGLTNADARLVVGYVNRAGGVPQVVGTATDEEKVGDTTVTLPSTQVDDLILVGAVSRGTGSAIATNGGTFDGGSLTEIAVDPDSGLPMAKMWWVRATKDHGGQTLSFTGGVLAMCSSLCVVRYALSSGDPIEQLVTFHTASDNTGDLGELSAVTAGSLIFYGVATRRTTYWTGAAPTMNGVGMSEVVLAESNGGDAGTSDECSLMLASAPAVSTGGTGAFDCETGASTIKELFAFSVKAESASGPSITTPAGYTEICNDAGTGGGLMVAWKAVVSDSAPAVTFNNMGSGDVGYATVGGIRGGDLADFLDQVGAVSHNAAAQDVGPVAGITPADADTMVLVVFAKAYNYVSSDILAGDGLQWQRAFGHSSAVGNRAMIVAQFAIESGTVAVTGKTLVVQGGVADVGVGVMFNVNPDATTPPPSAQYGLDVATTGLGSGVVTGPGISCPTQTDGDCEEIYPSGQSVTLTAQPNAGSVFVGWTGDVTSSSPQIILTMNAAKNLVAEFGLAAPPGGSGIVSVIPGSGAPVSQDLFARSDSYETGATGLEENWEYSDPWRYSNRTADSNSPPGDPYIKKWSANTSPFQVPGQSFVSTQSVRLTAGELLVPDIHGHTRQQQAESMSPREDSIMLASGRHDWSIYDEFISGNSHTRTGLYKGHKYLNGERSVTYLDVFMQANRASVFPYNLGTGGGNTNFSQLLQLKTWGGHAFLAISQAKNGIKTSLAKAVSTSKELLLPCPAGQWIRIAIEAYWKTNSSSPNTGQNGGWFRLWADFDQNGMKCITLPSYVGSVAGSDGKIPQDLLSPSAGTWVCFGPYHRFEHFTNGSVITDYANVSVCQVAA